MHKQKNFIVIDENFTCEHCGTKNPPAPKTCRNHCKECLWSKHVDETVPGDRKSTCRALMEPVKIEGGTNRKGYTILYNCTRCEKIIRNKTAPDDNMEALIAIAQKNAHTIPKI